MYIAIGLVGLFIYIVLCSLVADSAQHKGRDYWSWWIISFLFLPVAFVIVSSWKEPTHV